MKQNSFEIMRGPQLVNIFPAYYGTPRLITAFKRATPTQSMPHPIS